jgi:nicotinamidase-related amidase
MALLIIDMISSWEFPDAAKLLPRAAAIAPRIAALKARCRRSGIPVIYANDNRGQWRSDFRQVVRDALAQGGAGALITQQLQPDDDDYFVLKPKHSAFFATPLDLLLQHLQAQALIMTGVASDQCVSHTAADARMRDYEVVVPGDCVASQSAARNRRAELHFEEVLQVSTTPSARLRFPKARS